MLLCCVIFFLPDNVCAQTENSVDSLKKIIQDTRCDTTRMRSLMILAELYYPDYPDTSFIFYSATKDLALKVIKTSRNPDMVSGAKRHLASAYYNLGYVNDDFGNADTAFSYYTKSLDVFKELAAHPDSTLSRYGKQGEANVFNDLGYMFKYQGDLKKALNYYSQSMKFNREIGNYKQVATLLNNIGTLYRTAGNISLALHYISRSFEIAGIIKDNEEIAYSANSLASIYDNQGNVAGAIQYYQISLKAYERMGSKNGQAFVFNNLAILFFGQGDYVKALEYYRKAAEYFEKSGDKKSRSILCNNIGAVYEKLGQVDEALGQYRISQQLSEESGYRQGVATALGNIGLLLEKAGKTAEAMECYRKSAEISEDIGEKQTLITAMVNMGTLNLEMNNIQKALQLGQRSYRMSKEMGFPNLIKSSAGLLKQVYRRLGNYKEAMDYYELEIKMRDSLANEENYKQIMQQQARYEYEKKAATDSLEYVKAIEIKNLEIARVEEEKEKQRIIMLTFVAGFVIILLFSVALFRLYVQKKKANKILAEQKKYIEKQNETLRQANEEISAQRDEIEAQRDLVTDQKNHIEEQKKEITDSITYARRIQRAVLPDLASVFGILRPAGTSFYCCDYFVLYKPKDIVSGDFYWASRIGNWCIFTVADCTGHGVPGAFMSMLGISNLNEIVRRKEITTTGEVLDKLREAVIGALKQKGVMGEQKDGMDIVFCAYNTQSGRLQFSGANNSLYLIRNENEGGVLKEYKADPQPVAIHVNMTPFTTHEIEVKKGDQLYLISDGYPDQFGGPKNKKFMIKRLRELFIAIAPMSLPEQQAVLSAEFEKWKGGAEQVDDVTIMGVRL